MAKITHYKKEWLKSIVLIDRPHGKVELTVANDVTEKNRINATEPGKSDKYIVTLKAVAKDQFARLKALFTNREEVPIEEVNNLFMTASIWVNGSEQPQLPMKGESIFASVDLVDNADKTEKLLRVTNVKLKAAERVTAMDFDTFFAEAVAGEAEEGAAATQAAVSAGDVLQQA